MVLACADMSGINGIGGMRHDLADDTAPRKETKRRATWCQRSYAAPDGMTSMATRGFEGHDADLMEQLRRDILETCVMPPIHCSYMLIS